MLDSAVRFGAAFLPSGVAVIVGIVLAIMRRRVNPDVARPALIGLVLHLLVVLLSASLVVVLPALTGSGWTPDQVFQLSSVIGLVTVVVTVLAWTLLLTALFRRLPATREDRLPTGRHALLGEDGTQVVADETTSLYPVGVGAALAGGTAVGAASGGWATSGNGPAGPGVRTDRPGGPRTEPPRGIPHGGAPYGDDPYGAAAALRDPEPPHDVPSPDSPTELVPAVGPDSRAPHGKGPDEATADDSDDVTDSARYLPDDRAPRAPSAGTSVGAPPSRASGAGAPSAGAAGATEDDAASSRRDDDQLTTVGQNRPATEDDADMQGGSPDAARASTGSGAGRDDRVAADQDLRDQGKAPAGNQDDAPSRSTRDDEAVTDQVAARPVGARTRLTPRTPAPGGATSAGSAPSTSQDEDAAADGPPAPRSTGPSPSGPSPAGPSPAGPSPAGPSPAGPSPAGPSPSGSGSGSAAHDGPPSSMGAFPGAVYTPAPGGGPADSHPADSHPADSHPADSHPADEADDDEAGDLVDVVDDDAAQTPTAQSTGEASAAGPTAPQAAAPSPGGYATGVQQPSAPWSGAPRPGDRGPGDVRPAGPQAGRPGSRLTPRPGATRPGPAGWFDPVVPEAGEGAPSATFGELPSAPASQERRPNGDAGDDAEGNGPAVDEQDSVPSGHGDRS